jgi:hypothetical protein
MNEHRWHWQGLAASFPAACPLFHHILIAIPDLTFAYLQPKQQTPAP